MRVVNWCKTYVSVPAFQNTSLTMSELVLVKLQKNLKLIWKGSESSDVKKTRFFEKWDQIVAVALTASPWSQENVIQGIVEKQLHTLNNGRKHQSNMKIKGVKVSKPINHRNKIIHVVFGYACRACLTEQGGER